MTIFGIQAEGTIDIRAAVVSGKAHSGSAGILIMFLSTLITISGLAFGPAEPTKPSKADRAKSFLWGSLLLLCVIMGLGWIVSFNASSESVTGLGMALFVFGLIVMGWYGKGMFADD